jgi:hypothetical protein
MPATFTWGAGGVNPPYTPLVFTNIGITALGGDTATVEWDVSPAAQGQVQYDVDQAGGYAFASSLVTEFLTHHAITLTGLSPDTAYYYKVRGVSVSGQEALSGENTFTTSPDLVIEGFGSDALTGLGAGSYVVSSTASGTGAGTWGGAWAWLAAGNQGTITFAIDGTFPVPAQVNTLTGKSHFMIDGRGRSVDLSGGCLKFSSCHHFAVVNVAHTGGWDGGQNADNFTNVSSNNFAYVNVSTRNGFDEGISSTINCMNYTLQDCLFGIGETGSAGDPYTSVIHNFGSLNYGGTAGVNGPGSFIRCTWIDKDYRNPKCAYRNDGNSTPDPGAITYHVVNNVAVGCNYGLSVELGAKVRSEGNYYQACNNGDYAETGGTIGSYTVPGWAQVSSVLSAAAAATYAKTHAGRLPHDAFDTTILAEIT